MSCPVSPWQRRLERAATVPRHNRGPCVLDSSWEAGTVPGRGPRADDWTFWRMDRMGRQYTAPAVVTPQAW